MSARKRSQSIAESSLPQGLDTRDIVFTNLLLLGFEPTEYERRHSIPFNRDMFALPNKKAFEVVMYFLFDRLNPVMTHEKFRDCWPIRDKKQEQTFRKAVSTQLSEISTEDPLANLPRIVPSLFMSPSGDRFYSLLLHFSHYVLYKVVRQENGKKEREMLHRPKLLPTVSHLSHIMVRTLQAATIRHRNRFLERAQVVVILHQEWKLFANELVKEHRSLMKQLGELERGLCDCLTASYDQAQARGSPMANRRRTGGTMSSGERELHAVRRTQKIHKVREMWRVVEAFHTAHEPQQEIVSALLQEFGSKYRLDASEINVQVPEMLLRECQQELQRRNFGNTYEAGNLNLLTLVQLWNLSLRLYQEKLQIAPMPRFEELSSDVVTQVHTHRAHLANTQAMRSTLTNEVLPDLKASVGHLRKQVQEGKTPNRKPTAKNIHHIDSLGLGLLPPTPPISFEPAPGYHDKTPRLLATGDLRIKTPTDTPEAVSTLRRTINKAALQHAGLVQGTPTSTLEDVRRITNGPSKISVLSNNIKTESLLKRKGVKSAPSKVVSSSTSSSVRTPTSRHSVIPSSTTSSVNTPTSSRSIQTPNLAVPDPSQGRARRAATRPGRVAGGGKSQPRGNRLARESRENKADRARKKIESSPADVLTPFLQRTQSRTKTPSTGSVTRTAPKAHQLLAEQIAEAVTSGGRITPDFLEMMKASSTEHTPHDAVTPQDPLAGLDDEAFISKDKLQRTPVSDDGTSDAAQRSPRDIFLSKTLFESDSSPDQPSSQTSGETDDSTVRNGDHGPLSGKHSLTKVLMGDLLDLEVSEFHGFGSPQTTALLDDMNSTAVRDYPQETFPYEKDSSHRGNPVETKTEANYRLNRNNQGSTGNYPLGESLETESSQSFQLPTSLVGNSDRQTLSSLDDDYDDNGEDNMTKRPLELSEGLEQTLAEIFQTRTPQLTTRAMKRTQPRQGTPIAPRKQDVQNESTLRLLNLITDTDPIEGLTPNLSRLRRDRVSRQNSTRNQSPLTMSSTVLSNDRKPRQVSGESQKSVTFSEHVDERSFESSPDQSTVSADSPSVTEADLSSSPGDEMSPDGESSRVAYLGTPNARVGLSNLGEGTPAFLSDMYLTRSPSPQTQTDELIMSPLDSRLGSDPESSPDQPLKLIDISPDITPSKTPTLTSRSQTVNSHGTTPQSIPQKVPRVKNNVEALANNLAGGTSGMYHVVNQLSGLCLSDEDSLRPYKTPDRYTNVDSIDLLDEDDSILLPTSPAFTQGILVDIESPTT